MSHSQWHEEPIRKAHDRAGFDCGEPALNDFLKVHARQSHERGASKSFVAVASANGKTILGFYNLSPASIECDRAPDIVRRMSGRYDVPGFRLGRLAVSLSAQGRGLGGELLLCAGRRCINAAREVGGTVMFIDAKSERAAKWYKRYGAIALDESPLSLIIALETIASALK